MAKSDITIEQAEGVIAKVSAELGLLRSETSGFLKVQGPGNKHRVYVQKSRSLGRIDTTIPLAADDPAFKDAVADNGSISCHVVPDLEQLERVLRMLADSALATQTPNKPRPFAVNKAPTARRPKAVAPPIPADALREDRSEVPKELEDRLAYLKARGREAKISNILENPEKYGSLSYDEAAAWLDSKRTLRELADEHRQQLQVETAAQVADVAQEAGIDDAMRDAMLESDVRNGRTAPVY